MIEAVPKGLFSGGFQLQLQDRCIAELDPSAWRERAEVSIDGAGYRMYRQGLISGEFVLERNGEVVARAMKVSVFSDSFELWIGSRSFTLRKESLWSRRFGLFEGNQRVGGVAPAGMFTRRTLIDLPREWPAPIQTFVFWLALVIWNRERSAS